MLLKDYGNQKPVKGDVLSKLTKKPPAPPRDEARNKVRTSTEVKRDPK